MKTGRNIFDQPIKNYIKTYYNMAKISIGQVDDYITGCLLDFTYFKENCKLVPTDSNKRQAFDADPKAIQQINFSRNIVQKMQQYFSLLKKQEKKNLNFSQGTVRLMKNNNRKFVLGLYNISIK